MSAFSFSIAYSRISARFVASPRDESKLFGDMRLASPVICIFSLPMLAIGTEKLHI